MPIIKGENLTFEYSYYSEETDSKTKSEALSGVDIQIAKGEFIAILGHNGSGKSTLAKHMNALLRPTSGTIWVNGYNTTNDQDLWNIRQSAGMVFQNPDNQLIATIVEDDIAFGPENLGIAPEEIRNRVNLVLESVGMLEYKERSPHLLSGGQKQRVSIAGVLAMKPECIILDEPTAMLDPSGRIEVMNTIMRLNKEENITIILITHYMDEAIKADRVVVMENGKIIMNNKPVKVFSQVEELRKLRLDVPQVTELAYNLKKLGLDIPDGILTIEEMVGAILNVAK